MYLEDERLNALMGLGEPMEQFIRTFVNSFVKWEIVLHCSDHPESAFKVEDLAKKLNRPVEQVRRETMELSGDGFLTRSKAGRSGVWQYRLALSRTRAPERWDLLQKFAALCRVREGRLRVIYKILKHGKPLTE
jgi:hypothetical protein